MTRKTSLEDFIEYCKEHGIEVTYDVNSENPDTFETFFGDMIEQLESNSLSVKFDEYCKKHKDTCDDDCDVGKCMRDFYYQQGYDDAMELLSGTSVAYSFLNAEKHKAYQQGRTDAIDKFANRMKKLVSKWFDSGVINVSHIDKIAEELKGEKA